MAGTDGPGGQVILVAIIKFWGPRVPVFITILGTLPLIWGLPMQWYSSMFIVELEESS